MKYPVKWSCKRLRKVLIASNDAIPDPIHGFMCDCMDPIKGDYENYHIHWVKQDDDFHKILQWGHTK